MPVIRYTPPATASNEKHAVTVEMYMVCESDIDHQQFRRLTGGTDEHQSVASAQQEILARLARLDLPFRVKAHGHIVDSATKRTLKHVSPYSLVFGAEPLLSKKRGDR